MRIEDYRRIFDFFFSGSEVPEELCRQFFIWIEAHGDEPETKELLEEYWNEVSSTSPEFDMEASLKRLMASVCGENDNSGMNASSQERAAGNQTSTENGTLLERTCGRISMPGGEKRGRKVWKYCIAAAAAMFLFAGGAVTSGLLMRSARETVLMASSENIGSYTLPDGSKVWLNKNSWLSYNQRFGRRIRKVDLNGEGYFEVSRDESCPFIVKMRNNLQVKVLGTTFNACSSPAANTAEVILRSGSVQVLDERHDKSFVLMPNQKYTWNDGVSGVSSVNAMDCCRWFENRLVFDNVKLKDILENLSHKYQLTIRHNIGTLAEKRMSMTIRDETVEDFLDILATLLPVRWRYQGPEIIIENKTKKHR